MQKLARHVAWAERARKVAATSENDGDAVLETRLSYVRWCTCGNRAVFFGTREQLGLRCLGRNALLLCIIYIVL